MHQFVKRILFVMLATLPFMSVEAQVVRLPAEFHADHTKRLASASNSLRQLLPDTEFKLLPVVSDDKVNQLASELLDFAGQFMGLRYRRGGKTPSGFDCSGFTGYVFKEFGYNLSASSAAQFNDGHKVADDEIQPGDLVFFNGRTRGKHVGHVGIAISADPVTGVITFIHSSVTGGIRIDRTDTPYYAARYLGARRVLPD